MIQDRNADNKKISDFSPFLYVVKRELANSVFD